MATQQAIINQISPRQRGYRDGCRHYSNQGMRVPEPYAAGSWAYHEWLAGLLEAVNDYNNGVA